MKTRKEHAEEIRKLAGEAEDAKSAVVEYARQTARQVAENPELGEAEKRSALQELLLGIEDGLREAGMEAKLILLETMDAFVFVFGDILEQTAEALRSYYEDLRRFAAKAWEAGEEAVAGLERLIRSHDGEDAEKKD